MDIKDSGLIDFFLEQVNNGRMECPRRVPIELVLGFVYIFSINSN